MDRGVKGIERVKGAQSKPNSSPNDFPKLCEWFSCWFLLKGRGTRTVSSLRGKSSWNLPNRQIKRKESLNTNIMMRNHEGKLGVEIITGNYQWKLWVEIITENYQLLYQSRGKCEIYRDTSVSKNKFYAFQKIYNFFKDMGQFRVGAIPHLPNYLQVLLRFCCGYMKTIIMHVNCLSLILHKKKLTKWQRRVQDCNCSAEIKNLCRTYDLITHIIIYTNISHLAFYNSILSSS